jgi:hypothetical protein
MTSTRTGYVFRFLRISRLISTLDTIVEHLTTRPPFHGRRPTGTASSPRNHLRKDCQVLSRSQPSRYKHDEITFHMYFRVSEWNKAIFHIIM